jgi:hypothetical protein
MAISPLLRMAGVYQNCFATLKPGISKPECAVPALLGLQGRNFVEPSIIYYAAERDRRCAGG